MKIIGYLLIIIFVILAFFGFLIGIEYLKYFRRKVALKLKLKLDNEVSNND